LESCSVQLSAWNLGTSDKNWDVSGNKIYNNDSSPDLSYARAFTVFGTKTENNEFYNNLIKDLTTQSQIAGVNNTFHHNIFDGVTQSDIRPKGFAVGIILIPTKPDIECNGNKFDNNTFINCEDAGIKISSGNLLPDAHDNYFRNNIMYNCGSVDAAPLVIQSNADDLDPAGVYDNPYWNNLVYNTNTNIPNPLYHGTSYSIGDFENLPAGDIRGNDIANNINVDPLFTNPTSPYVLNDLSPCRNNGDISVILNSTGGILSNSEFNKFDFYDSVFPNEAPDIGAIEINPTVTKITEDDCERELTVDNIEVSYYPIIENTEGYTVKLINSNFDYIEFYNASTTFDISDHYDEELRNSNGVILTGEFLKPYTWYGIKIKKGDFNPAYNYSNYGGNCNIRTPRFTFLTSEYCDQTNLLNIGDSIDSCPFPNATQYVFQFTLNGNSVWLFNSSPSITIPNTAFFRTGGTYSVKVRDIAAAYGTQCTIVIEETTNPGGDEKMVSNDLNYILYPNPCHDTLHILSYGAEINIQIFSIGGKKLINKKISENDNTIDVSQLSVGTYILGIYNGEEATFQNFIKK